MDKLAAYIDYAVLNPELTPSEIAEEAKRAVELGCATVCVNPAYCACLSPIVAGKSTSICPVVDFPFGASSTESRVAQIRSVAKFDAVKEIDIVCQYGKLREGLLAEVTQDLVECVKAVRENGKSLKVILETDALNDEQIRQGCDCSIAAGADFVKTSTGFYASPEAVGASPSKVAVMLKAARGKCKVKASGQIRTREQALELLSMGVDRLGIGSKSVKSMLAKALLALLLLGTGSTGLAANESQSDKIKYFDALSQMGGSVLTPLAQKLNALTDAKLAASGPVARVRAVESISGKVGGIRVQPSGCCGNGLNETGYTYINVDFSKDMAKMGGKISTLSRPTAVRKSRQEGCRLAVPPGFMDGFDTMQSLARRKIPDACGEVGACIFLGVTSGQMQANLAKGTDMLKLAYNQGNLEAGFIYAFSLYYGIGLKHSDKTGAYSVIANLVEQSKLEKNKTSKTKSLLRSGWMSRRIEEAVSIGILESKP